MFESEGKFVRLRSMSQKPKSSSTLTKAQIGYRGGAVKFYYFYFAMFVVFIELYNVETEVL